MSLVVVCPSCKRRWQVPEKLAGRPANCPSCGTAVPPPPAEVEDVEVAEDEPGDVLDVIPADSPRPERDLARLPRLLKARQFLIQGSGSQYVILDAESNRELAVATEGGGGSEQMLRVLGSSGGRRETHVNVFDAWTDKELFHIERSAFQQFIGQSPLQVEIFEADRCLGSFETQMFPSRGAFWIYDSRDRKVAELDGQWHPRPDYRYFGRNGDRLGRLKTEVERRHVFTGAFGWCRAGGSLLLTLSEHLADRPEDKILLLATALILEMGVASIRMGPIR
jgi:hypothetical protein